MTDLVCWSYNLTIEQREILTNTERHSELTKLIADENFAREFIEFLRWPNGAICPRCEATKVYKLAANEEKKIRKGLYKCAACKKQFTVTVGTIFEDSHVAEMERRKRTLLHPATVRQ